MTNASPAAGGGIRARISSVGRDLAAALGALVDSVAERPAGAQRVAQVLEINKITSHRLVTALRRKDPLATVHQMPGPEPLRRMVKAARKKGVSDDVTNAAEQAIGAFEQLIAGDAGDRGSLDAIISAMLPDLRVRYETTAKQTIYRGMRQVRGIAADVMFNTFLIHPARDPARADHVWLYGYLGVCRIRPSAQLRVGVVSLQTVPIPGQEPPSTLDGRPIEGLDGVVLERFCTNPVAQLTVQRQGQDATYMMDWGDAVGVPSARDVVLAEIRRNTTRRYRPADDLRTRSGEVIDISLPARVMICDFILHEDVYPGQGPRLRVLDLGVKGAADLNDDTRDDDVLDIVETVQPLGLGIDHFGCEQIPNYTELLRHACGKLGWNPSRFRGYRCRVDYPIVGTQVQFAFDVPLQNMAAAEGG